MTPPFFLLFVLFFVFYLFLFIFIYCKKFALSRFIFQKKRRFRANFSFFAKFLLLRKIKFWKILATLSQIPPVGGSRPVATPPGA